MAPPRSRRSGRYALRAWTSHLSSAARRGMVNFRDDNRPFSDGGCHSFDRAGAYVSDCKQSRDTRFMRMRRACDSRKGRTLPRRLYTESRTGRGRPPPAASPSVALPRSSRTGSPKVSAAHARSCGRAVLPIPAASPCPPTTSVFTWTLIIGIAEMASTSRRTCCPTAWALERSSARRRSTCQVQRCLPRGVASADNAGT